MRVLVVGSGGREHALAWKIAASPRADRVLAAPGSDGMAAVAECHRDVSAGDVEAVVGLARREAIDLVVIGPEDPLAAGISDRLRESGFAVFGPSAAAARIEASKSFAREFMARQGVPQPRFAVFDEIEKARAHVEALAGPCAVKADGLAAGKGVAICDTPEQAGRALDEIMGARRFGAAGDTMLEFYNLLYDGRDEALPLEMRRASTIPERITTPELYKMFYPTEKLGKLDRLLRKARAEADT